MSCSITSKSRTLTKTLWRSCLTHSRSAAPLQRLIFASVPRNGTLLSQFSHQTCKYSTASTEGASSAKQTSQEQLFTQILTKNLEPEYLLVSDISGGCGSMYRVQCVSKHFEGKSLVKQHQMVYGLLREYIPGMHGLTMITKTPAEFAKIKEKQKEQQ